MTNILIFIVGYILTGVLVRTVIYKLLTNAPLTVILSALWESPRYEFLTWPWSVIKSIYEEYQNGT